MSDQSQHDFILDHALLMGSWDHRFVINQKHYNDDVNESLRMIFNTLRREMSFCVCSIKTLLLPEDKQSETIITVSSPNTAPELCADWLVDRILVGGSQEHGSRAVNVQQLCSLYSRWRRRPISICIDSEEWHCCISLHRNTLVHI